MDGNKWQSAAIVDVQGAEEEIMPVLLLWAIPAVVVLGGGTYLLFLK